jgi:Mg-chelatase subunit ChlD
MADTDLALARWRLVLGRFAEQGLGCDLTSGYGRMDRVLDHLYGREYQGRQTIGPDDSDGERSGGRGDSVLSVPEWIRQVRDLFPNQVCEVVTRHALERYGMTELVTDADTLKTLEPSYDLLKAVLSFRGMMQGRVLEVAREIVKKVSEELRRKLESEVRRALSGRADRNQRSRFKQARNLHLKRTLEASLKHYDPDKKRLTAADLHFFSRLKRHTQWQIIICVDCSGSMVDSVIHSAVMAGIFHALPSIRVRLVAFDTNVVDLSDRVDDPVEVLMSVQLGGGTDIGAAMHYCASLVEQPTRTIVVLVTDFYEGGSPGRLIQTVKQLCGAGVRVWTLAALDQQAQPMYDHQIAVACATAGAEVAALTPERLSEWVAKVVR